MTLRFCHSAVFAIVALLAGLPQDSYSWNFETLHSSSDSKICAKLSEPRLGVSIGGETLQIAHGQQIFDLNDVYSDATFKQDGEEIKSWGSLPLQEVQVNPGCSVSICSEPYFQENCTRIFSNKNKNESTTLQKFSSTSCKCANDCETSKCPEVKLRGILECARGFIETGCNTCSGIYLDYNVGNVSFIGEFADRENASHALKSFVVKPGCKIYTYDERDFDGAVQIFQAGFHENLHGGRVDSFKCDCVNSLTMVSDSEAETTQPLAPFIQIPGTIEEMTKQFSPETLKTHPGVLATIKSLENGRSPRNAYVMVLGMSGAGKSASINFLFGNRSIAEIGEVESVTSEIHEYIFPVPLAKFGINNSQLHVIDTPGLGDTRGLAHDAQFLATLETYLSTHPELSTRVPNVVLIFAKFTENRFSGEGASFVKMLRGLDLLSAKLFDKQFSNVVIILTHYVSESRKLQKNPVARIAQFKKVVENYSLFPKPIVIAVAENQPEEAELPRVNGGYYQLPTGELYPLNVFEKILQLTQNGGDPIGNAIVKSAFKQPEILKMVKKVTPLIPNSDPKVRHYLNILTAANFKVEETQVSTILAKVYSNDTLFPLEVKAKYPDTLPYLQLVMNVRNIFKVENVPKTSGEIVRLLKDIRKTPATISLLELGLGIKAPNFEVPLLVGRSYDLRTDSILDSSALLRTTDGNNKVSELGFAFPASISCKPEKSATTRNLNLAFNSKEEYLESRLSNLGVERAEIAVNIFDKTLRASGHNLMSNSGTTGMAKSAKVYLEIRLFGLELIPDKIVVSNEFIPVVKSLPPFTLHDRVTVDRWNAFFNLYGTHVIQSAAGGGALELESSEGVNNKVKLATMVQIAEDLVHGKIITIEDFASENYSISLYGGTSNFSTATLLPKNLSFTERSNLIKNWKESLPLSPVMLESSVKLIPISEIAKLISVDSARQISRALAALLSSASAAGLVYTPDPEIQRRLERERAEEAVRKLKSAEEQAREAEQKKAEEAQRLELERKQEELKKMVEETRLELERIQREVEAEKIRQQKALAELEAKLAAENAKRRADEEREIRRVAELRRLELERLAEQQRIKAARLEEERRRDEAARAEQQRLEREKVARELAAQAQRQLEAEQALQRQLETERQIAAAAKKKADEEAAAAAQEAAAFANLGCPQNYRRGKRSLSNATNIPTAFPKYLTLYSKYSDDELNIFTHEEVSRHDSPDDSWVILFDRVYDVTSFLEKHPGGKAVMLEYSGEDATPAFQSAGHGKIEKLEPYLIGVVPKDRRIFSLRYVIKK